MLRKLENFDPTITTQNFLGKNSHLLSMSFVLAAHPRPFLTFISFLKTSICPITSLLWDGYRSEHVISRCRHHRFYAIKLPLVLILFKGKDQNLDRMRK
jgi:hypothetical protein